MSDQFAWSEIRVDRIFTVRQELKYALFGQTKDLKKKKKKRKKNDLGRTLWEWQVEKYLSSEHYRGLPRSCQTRVRLSGQTHFLEARCAESVTSNKLAYH